MQLQILKPIPPPESHCLETSAAIRNSEKARGGYEQNSDRATLLVLLTNACGADNSIVGHIRLVVRATATFIEKEWLLSAAEWCRLAVPPPSPQKRRQLPDGAQPPNYRLSRVFLTYSQVLICLRSNWESSVPNRWATVPPAEPYCQDLSH